MPNRLTRLEIAAADCPEILLAAKHGLDRGKSSLSVAQHLSTKFHLTLSKSTVEKYRRKRWQVQRDELAQQKRNFQTAAAMVGENGLSRAASAILFQQVRNLNPSSLIGLLRVDVQQKTLKLKRRALRSAEKADPRTNKQKWDNMSQEERDNAGKKAADSLRSIFGVGTFEEEEEKARALAISNAKYFVNPGHPPPPEPKP